MTERKVTEKQTKQTKNKTKQKMLDFRTYISIVSFLFLFTYFIILIRSYSRDYSQ